jgi:pimeloyl-ACP methyl ester carboxylesterase
MPAIPINGVKLNYIHLGHGPDVVLAHGLASSLAFWYPGIVLPLRRGHRVTAYDLRGHGYSSMPYSGYTHMNMADDLAGLVDRLGLRKFHLVGHSFGGLVSISYAQRYPHRLKSLVLADVPLNEINAVPEWPLWWPGLLKFRNLGIVIQANEPYPELTVLEELARPHVRQRVGQLLPESKRLPYGWSKGTERTAKRWLELLHRTTAREDIRFRQISAADLSQVDIRTLAIYGTKSKWRSSSDILQDCLPKVEVAYIDQAGHAHPWERPEDFLNHLVPFLAESDRLDPDPSHSRRQYERLPVEMPVYLRTAAGIYYPARTLNASRNGLLLDCPEALGGNREIEIVAPMQQEGSTLVIPGKIVREARDIAGEGFRLGLNLLWEGEPDGQHEIWEEFLARH